MATYSILSDRLDTHSILGTLDGFYSNGSFRANVQVQRTDGSFAMLNSNKHQMAIHRVLSALRQDGLIEAYKVANAAAVEG